MGRFSQIRQSFSTAVEKRVSEKKLTMDTTGLVVYIGILTLAIYDLTVVLLKGTTSSVSQFLINTVFKSPLVSFTFGATCGHLFFYMWDTDCQPNLVERFLVAGCGMIIGGILTWAFLKFQNSK
jgi:hypothetical protein